MIRGCRLGASQNRPSQAGPSALGWIHKEGKGECVGVAGLKEKKKKTAGEIGAN